MLVERASECCVQRSSSMSGARTKRRPKPGSGQRSIRIVPRTRWSSRSSRVLCDASDVGVTPPDSN